MISYRGHPVSEGSAAGTVYLPDAPPPPGVPPLPHTPLSPHVPHPPHADVAEVAGAILDQVRAAFAAVAADRAQLAERLRAADRDRDAGIVQIGALIAADTALTGPALDAVRSGTPAATAVRDAAEAQASILEALPNPDLAQRAGDVRQVAEAVVAHLTGAAPAPPPAGPFILIRREVDPADLIRLADTGPAHIGPVGSRLADTDRADDDDRVGDDRADSGPARARLVGAVSVGGGASSHAAIIARGLGLPMLAGADPAVLAVPAGRPAILDTITGELVVDPPPDDIARACAPPPLLARPLAPNAHLARVSAETRLGAAGHVYTADGELVTVLCNVASAAETRLGLVGGAAGVGLLRTEIPFTRASTWPSREEHLAHLHPILRLLEGRKAVVRLLDFSGDKIPFLGAEGLTALLRAPGALGDQLAAILDAAAGTDLAVMIPMVRSLDEVSHVRSELSSAAKRAGTPPPPLGIMVEVAATAEAARRFAPHVDFLSIGTNDLTADVLGRERAALLPSAASQRPVLTLIAHVVRAARQAGIGLSVCGDAAADPAVLPLLIGVGVRTVSVGAARVPRVADWIGRIDAAEASARVAKHHAS